MPDTPLPIPPQDVVSVKDHVIRLWTEEGLEPEEISKIVGFAKAWCAHVITRWQDNQIKSGATQ